MKRSIQNQAIENFIGEAETFLLIITNDAEINPIMAAHGYDAAELSAGNALLQVAADAFGVRLTGISGKTEKHGDLVTSGRFSRPGRPHRARADGEMCRTICRNSSPSRTPATAMPPKRHGRRR